MLKMVVVPSIVRLWVALILLDKTIMGKGKMKASILLVSVLTALFLGALVVKEFSFWDSKTTPTERSVSTALKDSARDSNSSSLGEELDDVSALAFSESELEGISELELEKLLVEALDNYSGVEDRFRIVSILAEGLKLDSSKWFSLLLSVPVDKILVYRSPVGVELARNHPELLEEFLLTLNGSSGVDNAMISDCISSYISENQSEAVKFLEKSGNASMICLLYTSPSPRDRG